MHVHVCGGSEPEYTNDLKNFFGGPSLEECVCVCVCVFGGGGGKRFLVPLKQVKIEQMFFQHTFPISAPPPPPQALINDNLLNFEISHLQTYLERYHTKTLELSHSFTRNSQHLKEFRKCCCACTVY